MQVGVGIYQSQRQFHGMAHAHLVDVAHVEDFDANIMNQALLASVDAADADLANILWIERRDMAADIHQLARPVPAQTSDRHAVNVAARRQRRRIEIGMRIKPQNAQLALVDADTHLHVSLDVDFLDPDIAPGVGTTVRGGPTYREAQLCMEMIADTGRLASLDVVELNPAFDVRNRTAELAVDLIESLFGKSTLMHKAPARRHDGRSE